MNRRAFTRIAASLGATAAFGALHAAPSRTAWKERRDFFPEGVAPGDPDASSVLLWTRAPHATRLQVEVAADAQFEHMVATASTPVSADADFTCRVLVGGLKPASVYWYRFSDPEGNGSRIGRTITAPAANDPRPVSFAFVSCQNANQGAQNAYRRMIFEDERAGESDRLSFVLHLGDFIYEIVWYPEDRPQGMYDRRLRDIVRYASGEKIHDFHIPTTLDDYRAVYRAYLRDPDLQDARARWPFVNMWDNHEFSWLGWQSLQKFYGETRPAQTRKVAANQAFFEFQPARMARPHAGTLERFDGPHVENAPITAFDAHGLGQEPNNLAAIASLKGYRALRWGRHVELIVTDQRSYCSEEPSGAVAGKALVNDAFPQVLPQEAQNAGSTMPYASITYTAPSDVATMTMGNGLHHTFSWNDRLQQVGMQASASGSTLLNIGLYLCPSPRTQCNTNNGNILSQAIANPSASWMQTYGYDNLNRIASFQETGGLSQSFGYDPNGHGNMYVSGQTGLGAISAATPKRRVGMRRDRTAPAILRTRGCMTQRETCNRFHRAPTASPTTRRTGW